MRHRDEWSCAVLASGASRKSIKVAWLLLLAFERGRGSCDVERASIARRCGMSMDTLKECIAELERHELVQHRWEDRNGRPALIVYPAMPGEARAA